MNESIANVPNYDADQVIDDCDYFDLSNEESGVDSDHVRN